MPADNDRSPRDLSEAADPRQFSHIRKGTFFIPESNTLVTWSPADFQPIDAQPTTVDSSAASSVDSSAGSSDEN
jgi:hypothetical protein